MDEIAKIILRDYTYSCSSGDLFKCGSSSPCHLNHVSGYKRIIVNGKHITAHRAAWLIYYGDWPEFIDHVNHDKADNRIENLRNVSCLDNNKNQSLRSSNKLGFSGVYFCTTKNKWRAQIRISGVKTNLGTFSDLFDAISVVIKARKNNGYHENHGELNVKHA